jgi:hypothetical protein
MTLKQIFEEKIERYYLQSIKERVEEYCDIIDRNEKWNQ